MTFLQQVILLSLLSLTQSASIFWDWGRCPTVSVKSDFELDRYLGTWYEVARYKAPFQSFDDRCTTAKYEMIDDNSVSVYNSGIGPDGSVYDAEGVAKIPDKDEPAKLKVRFSKFGFAGDYWVLDTDYDQYAFVHSCQSFLLFHTQIDWILSRQVDLDQATIDGLYVKLENEGVDTTPMQLSNQEGCGEEDGN